MHRAVLIHYRLIVRGRPHFAGAGHMAGSPQSAEQIGIQQVIIGQFRIRGGQPFRRNFPVGFRFNQPGAQAHPFPQPFPIPRLLQIAVVKLWLDRGVGGNNPQLAAAHRHFQSAGYPHRAVGQILSGQGNESGIGHYHHIVAVFRPGGGVAQGHPHIMGIPRQIHPLPGPKGYAGRGMIPQVLPHAGQFPHHGDTQGVQLLGRPHSGQH